VLSKELTQAVFAILQSLSRSNIKLHHGIEIRWVNLSVAIFINVLNQVSILKVRVSILDGEGIVVHLSLIVGLVAVAVLQLAGGVSELLVHLVKKLIRIDVLTSLVQEIVSQKFVKGRRLGIRINELVKSNTLEVADVGGVVTALYIGLDEGLLEELHEGEIRCLGGLADLEFVSYLLPKDLKEDMAVVTGLHLLGELVIQEAVLQSQLSILLNELFYLCLVEACARVLLQDGVLVLVAGVIELRAHFGKLMGFIHYSIIVGGVFLYLIGVAFVVKQGN
jgi:hypothetical protein